MFIITCLFNFNAQNIYDINFMFYVCRYLKNINLSNFNTQNVIDMSYMFFECPSLIEDNIISKDNDIFDQFFEDNQNFLFH